MALVPIRHLQVSPFLSTVPRDGVRCRLATEGPIESVQNRPPLSCCETMEPSSFPGEITPISGVTTPQATSYHEPKASITSATCSQECLKYGVLRYVETQRPRGTSLMFGRISVKLALRDDYLADWAFTLPFRVSLETHRWGGILAELFLASPLLHL